MSDPFLKDITRQLLSDEVLHGQFGFFYLEEWRGWLEANPQVLVSLARYLRHAFVVLEKQLSGVGAPPKTLTVDERALGMPDPARLPETFYATIEGAVGPRARAVRDSRRGRRGGSGGWRRQRPDRLAALY